MQRSIWSSCHSSQSLAHLQIHTAKALLKRYQLNAWSACTHRSSQLTLSLIHTKNNSLPDNKIISSLLARCNLYAKRLGLKPPNSSFNRPQRSDASVRKKQHLWDQSQGNSFVLLAFLLIGEQVECVWDYRRILSPSRRSGVAQKWKINLCVNRKEIQEIHLWKRHIVADFACVVSQGNLCI